MYFTSLPDHTKPGFDEQLHFDKFKKHNIVFNAQSSSGFCDDHVGCLSFKTVLSGEEWYGINNHHVAIRPGQFLILNDDQSYSCRINSEGVRTLSVFFKKEFASAVFSDALHHEKTLLDNPHHNGKKTLEFFQTLHHIRPELQLHLSGLISALNNQGYDSCMMDESLVFMLHHLIRTHQADACRTREINAIKPGTRTEIYKRLCIAKDILHSSFMDKADLNTLSNSSCLSVPQLVRQFKAVFQVTPHQYLIQIRLKRAAELLKFTSKPIHEITWMCGFENNSSFCRAFKSAYGFQPGSFRKMS
jgi:AraC family transcriptional regulator